jgi:hypothetical protein
LSGITSGTSEREQEAEEEYEAEDERRVALHLLVELRSGGLAGDRGLDAGRVPTVVGTSVSERERGLGGGVGAVALERDRGLDGVGAVGVGLDRLGLSLAVPSASGLRERSGRVQP